MILTALKEQNKASPFPISIYIPRVDINQTVGDNQPNIREFAIYGEKIEGKTCLISQEVWFTIYSTVGAFYIPLAVILYMYKKIYAEALKFKLKPSQRKQSWTVAQTWNCASREPLVSASSYISCHTNMSNNRANSICDGNTQRNSNCDITSCSDEHLCCKSHRITIIVSDVDEEDDASYDDETVFSDSEYFSCKKNDDISQSAMDSGKQCCDDDPLNVENNEGKDLNGNCQQLELNPPQPNLACKPKKISFSDSLSPPNGTIHCHDNEPVPILRPDRKYTNNLTTGSNNALQLPSNGVINKNLKPHSRNASDKQLINNVRNGSVLQESLEVHGNLESNNELSSWQKAMEAQPCLKLEKQTEDKIQTKSSRFRHRILSRFAICCAKSLHCESSSPPPRMFCSRSSSDPSPSRRRSSIKRISFSLTNKKKSKLHNGSLETDSSVIEQIKRRVSMAISRDRKRNVKATRTLGVIVGAFTFCWLPFFIVTFLRPIVCENPESQDCIPEWLVRLVLWLGYLNSALNPFIYVGFSPDLRETFRFLLSFKCTNVDRRLAQAELRQAICREKRASVGSLTRCAPAESIL